MKLAAAHGVGVGTVQRIKADAATGSRSDEHHIHLPRRGPLGAGWAGLGVSNALKRADVCHRVLERQRSGHYDMVAAVRFHGPATKGLY
jgi:hypothetical protein